MESYCCCCCCVCGAIFAENKVYYLSNGKFMCESDYNKEQALRAEYGLEGLRLGTTSKYLNGEKK